MRDTPDPLAVIGDRLALALAGLRASSDVRLLVAVVLGFGDRLETVCSWDGLEGASGLGRRAVKARLTAFESAGWIEVLEFYGHGPHLLWVR